MPVALGYYNAQQKTANFGATATYLTQIELAWDEVPEADGYLLFREDLSGPFPLAVLEGSATTSYSDINLDINTEYTYSLVPYSVTTGNFFLGEAVSTSPRTEPFTFQVTSNTEADVTFEYAFDNHLLLGLIEQAAYIEIEDLTTGELLFDEVMSLTEVANEALLFDNALVLDGDDRKGVYAEPNVGSLSTWTVEMWMNPVYRNKQQILFDDGHVQVIATKANYLMIYVGSQLYTSSTTPFQTSTWNHLTLAYDGTHLSTYHNGEPLHLRTKWGGESSTSFAVSDMGLGSNLRLGQYNGGRQSSDVYQNFYGAWGMVRMWNKARSADQVAADWDDVFTQAPTGLLGQWTFEEENALLTDPLTGQVLAIETSDEANYPVTWKASFDFTDGVFTKYQYETFDEPVYNQDHEFQIRIYESGTGRLISSAKDNLVFPDPLAPQIAAKRIAGSPYEVELTITPSSIRANQYRIRRQEGTEWVQVAIVEGEANDEGDYWKNESFLVSDVYAESNSSTLLGGGSYVYEVTPMYGDYVDEHYAVTTSTVTVLDYAVAVDPNAGQTGLTVTWDANTLTTNGYDSVAILRDGEHVQYVLANAGTYTDSLILYGDTYTYTVQVWEQGQAALAQSGSNLLSPNGTFSGRVLSAQGNYVLPNKTLGLRNLTEGTDLAGPTADAYGGLATTGLYYGAEAEFALEDAAGNVLTNFLLSRSDWDADLGFVRYDTTLNTVAADSLTTAFGFRTVTHGLGFVWTPLDANQTLFTNVYRNGELVEVLVDQTTYTDYTGGA
ncbi:MAG TPA: hypothetical protein DCP28_37365, partial [Cytophagales bacterium]|nr:hypothetical protein [Cytophagales bacterium]